MLVRRESPEDVDAIRSVTAAAFRDALHAAPPSGADGDPGEAALVSRLRADPGWLPRFSLVAVDGDEVVGHVVATRAWVDDAPALGLGPLSVVPHRQRSGIGSALVHALLGAAEARDETTVGLLGDPAYYARFGFVPSRQDGITAPDPTWGDFFQSRRLRTDNLPTGTFRYATPFDEL